MLFSESEQCKRPHYKKIDCNQWFKERKQEYVENEYLNEEYEFSDDNDYLDYFKNFIFFLCKISFFEIIIPTATCAYH